LARQALAVEAVKSSTPNAEKIGWLLGCQMYTFRHYTFYEAIEKTASLGIRYVEACYYLPLCKERPGLKTNEMLSTEVRRELKAKLARHQIKMAVFRADLDSATSEEKCLRTFEFAKEMEAETIMSEPPVEMFDLIEKFCRQFQIKLAVHNHPKSPRSKYWAPENVLKVCEGRSQWIGACADIGHWVRSGLDAVECLKKLQGRIITIHLKDVAEWGKPEARDVPLGTGKGNVAEVFKELYRQGFRGVMSIEYEQDSAKLIEDLAACAAFVDKTARELAGQ